MIQGWEKPRERNRHIFCIEDPFDTEVDLGRNADETTASDIREEFTRAFKILIETGDLVTVMQPYDLSREGAAPFPHGALPLPHPRPGCMFSRAAAYSWLAPFLQGAFPGIVSRPVGLLPCAASYFLLWRSVLMVGGQNSIPFTK